MCQYMISPLLSAAGGNRMTSRSQVAISWLDDPGETSKDIRIFIFRTHLIYSSMSEKTLASFLESLRRFRFDSNRIKAGIANTSTVTHCIWRHSSSNWRFEFLSLAEWITLIEVAQSSCVFTPFGSNYYIFKKIL